MPVVPVPRLRDFLPRDSPLKTEQKEADLPGPTAQLSSNPQPERNQKPNASQVTLIGSLRAQVSFLTKQNNQSASRTDEMALKNKLNVVQTREHAAIDKITKLERDNTMQRNTISAMQLENARLCKEREEFLAEHRELELRYSTLAGLTYGLVQANPGGLGQLMSKDELKSLSQLLATELGSNTIECLTEKAISFVTPPPTPLLDSLSLSQPGSSRDTSTSCSDEPLPFTSMSSSSPQHDSSDDDFAGPVISTQPRKQIIILPPRPYKKRRLSEGPLDTTATPQTRRAGLEAAPSRTRSLCLSSTSAPSSRDIASSSSKRVRTCQRCLSTECPGRIRRHMCDRVCWRCGREECDSVVKGLHECKTV